MNRKDKEVSPSTEETELVMHLLSDRHGELPSLDHVNTINKVVNFLMRNKRNGYIKIGYSSKPFFREKTLQVEEPEVKLIACWEGTQKDEHALHEIFKDRRIRGEWFELSNNDVNDFIEEFGVILA